MSKDTESAISKRPTEKQIEETRELFARPPFFDNLGENRGVGAVARGKILFETHRPTSRTSTK